MRELIWGKTLRSRLIRYNFFIIWVIAIFVSVCTYITASRKTMEVAKNSLQHHVESISYAAGKLKKQEYCPSRPSGCLRQCYNTRQEKTAAGGFFCLKRRAETE